MTVLRVTTNLHTADPQALATFYQHLLGMDLLMDQGFICTVGVPGPSPVQISLASEGGSGTPLPAVSITVDDLDDVLARARAMTCDICYGPVTEPWGVRRFYLKDPSGTLVNILTHQ